MNDKPETPRWAKEDGDIPSDGTPTVNIGGSYEPPATPPAPPSAPQPPARDPYAWQPGQYGSPEAPSTGGAQPSYSPPPAYNPSSAGQGQPTQYAPPPLPYAQQDQPNQYTPQQFTPPQAGYPQPQYPQYPAPYGYAQPKDPIVALLLELIGYLGFLGIGHIWAGKVGRGIGLMVGYWVYWMVSVVLMIVLVGCLLLPLGFIFPILSGFWIKSEMEREQAGMRPYR